MKSFNFAFYISLYAAANGWAYLKAPKLLLVSIVLTLPLLFLAISGLRGDSGGDAGVNNSSGQSDNLSLLYESAAPVMSAMVVTVVFAIYLYEVRDAGLFFFLPRLQGWNYLDGIQLIVFGAGMGACGLGIWSAAPACAARESSARAASSLERIFVLRKTPGFRLVVYYLVILAAWCAGIGAAIGVDRIGMPWHAALIVGGRCAVPLSLLLVSAFIKAPMPAGAILAVGASWGLFFFNTGKLLDTVAFVAAQAIVFVCYAMVAKRFFGGGPYVEAVAAPEVSGEDNSDRDGS